MIGEAVGEDVLSGVFSGQRDECKIFGVLRFGKREDLYVPTIVVGIRMMLRMMSAAV